MHRIAVLHTFAIIVVGVFARGTTMDAVFYDPRAGIEQTAFEHAVDEFSRLFGATVHFNVLPSKIRAFSPPR